MPAFDEIGLWFAPQRVVRSAKFVPLAEEPHVAALRRWWSDPELKSHFETTPIDRLWDWQHPNVDFKGRELEVLSIGLATSDGEVQGAMLLSTTPVRSGVHPGQRALLVERLFAAPRNRQMLRHDGKPHYQGIGQALLAWAASFSMELGLHGRLRLEACPDSIPWYLKRGLIPLREKPTVFEGTVYRPMALTSPAAHRLLATTPLTPPVKRKAA